MCFIGETCVKCHLSLFPSNLFLHMTCLYFYAVCQRMKPKYMPRMSCMFSLLVLHSILCIIASYLPLSTVNPWVLWLIELLSMYIFRYNRGWFYHRELRLWFTRVSNTEPLVKNSAYERGSYICFDPNTWETIRKVCCHFCISICYLVDSRISHSAINNLIKDIDWVLKFMQDNFVLHYDMIEKRPALPQHWQIFTL